jgi:hypothetical protein
MEQIETISKVNEFLSNPALSIIFGFLLLVLGIVALVLFSINGMRESDVREAKAELKAVIAEARKYEKESRAKQRKIGAEKFVLYYECKQLRLEIDRLNYRIEQLTKGAEYVSNNAKDE